MNKPVCTSPKTNKNSDWWNVLFWLQNFRVCQGNRIFWSQEFWGAPGSHADMAKIHTIHNPFWKWHRNGIKKLQSQRHESLTETDLRFLGNKHFAKKHNRNGLKTMQAKSPFAGRQLRPLWSLNAFKAHPKSEKQVQVYIPVSHGQGWQALPRKVQFQTKAEVSAPSQAKASAPARALKGNQAPVKAL